MWYCIVLHRIASCCIVRTKKNSTKVINSFVTYHNNGYVKEEGILKMGQRDGIWKVYNDEGSHVETVTYANGKILKRQKA